MNNENNEITQMEGKHIVTKNVQQMNTYYFSFFKADIRCLYSFCTSSRPTSWDAF